MDETCERIYTEAVNLRSVARMERKKGNIELAHVIDGAADLYERTASDLESASKSLQSHSAAVIEQHAEITSLRSQLDDARAKITRLVAILDNENPWDQKHVNELNESMIDIRALLSESKT